jgi:hypothetical protein
MQVVYEGVLWHYHTLKNGEHTVKVRVTNYKNVEYINSGMNCILKIGIVIKECLNHHILSSQSFLRNWNK